MELIGIVGAIGIGAITASILTAVLQPIFQHKKQLKEWQHELKMKRYLAINILLITKIDIQTLSLLTKQRPNIITEADLDQEINTEYVNSFIFASDEVIEALFNFTQDDNFLTYGRVAKAMRKDLWGNTDKFSLIKSIRNYTVK